jgi:hypothetical protein
MRKILWSQRQDAGPVARTRHAMVYDVKRKRTVLFGGSTAAGGAGLAGDTWEWDGQYWVQVADFGPKPRQFHSMAYDENRSRVILFGGQDDTHHLGDTWEWDGEFWVQVAETGPSARSASATASDIKRKRVVLFGGRIENPRVDFSDTWEWDGDPWTQHEGVGPPAVNGHSMAYDFLQSRTVLFGGATRGGFFGGTWEWDGSTWLQVAQFGPQPRTNHQLAFDGSLVMLFGGATADLTGRGKYPGNGETWEWDGKRWTLRRVFGPSPRVLHAMSFDARLAGGTSVCSAARPIIRQPGLQRHLGAVCPRAHSTAGVNRQERARSWREGDCPRTRVPQPRQRPFNGDADGDGDLKPLRTGRP